MNEETDILTYDEALLLSKRPANPIFRNLSASGILPA